MVADKILVTGATGFVGRALTARLQGLYPVRVAVRPESAAGAMEGVEVAHVDLCREPGWAEALSGVRVVVHCAARVHVMNEVSADPLADFLRVNRDATIRLAVLAAAAGVRRFVFLSTIKVCGEQTDPGHPFAANQPPEPTDPYAVSKSAAEECLRNLARESGMDVVIIRPPLVYGPGVKANFRSLMGWLQAGVPLPLAAVDNRRSLVGLDNLVDLIVTCLDHPAAANQTFHVSDGEDLSTPELLRRLAAALERPARLLPVPTALIRLFARLLGRPALAERLCGSLQVDIDKTRRLLGWTPPIAVDEGLRRAVMAEFRGGK